MTILNRKLPNELYYKRNPYDSFGVRIKYIESQRYGEYFVKCDGSSSIIRYISESRFDDILNIKDQEFFLKRSDLQAETVRFHKSRVQFILENSIAEGV